VRDEMIAVYLIEITYYKKVHVTNISILKEIFILAETKLSHHGFMDHSVELPIIVKRTALHGK